MSLLRKGSSRISDDNFNCRLQREKAKSGAVTVSLAWNDPSDLDLEATVILEKGGQAKIFYGNKQACGGVWGYEPVENIFWKKPLAGTYSISIALNKKHGTRGAAMPFRALLKCDVQGGRNERVREDVSKDVSKEGEVRERERRVEVFRFTVDDDGDISMGRVGTPLPKVKPGPSFVSGGGAGGRAMRVAVRRAPPMKAMKVMKVKVMKVMKVSTIAKGKKSKVAVWRGKKVKTKGGLKKEHLVKSKSRKIVSAARSQAGKNSKWAKATAKARAIKGYTGFKAIKKGTSFYEKAKEVLAEM